MCPTHTSAVLHTTPCRAADTDLTWRPQKENKDRQQTPNISYLRPMATNKVLCDPLRPEFPEKNTSPIFPIPHAEGCVLAPRDHQTDGVDDETRLRRLIGPFPDGLLEKMRFP
jgi:hypothetical protein